MAQFFGKWSGGKVSSTKKKESSSTAKRAPTSTEKRASVSTPVNNAKPTPAQSPEPVRFSVPSTNQKPVYDSSGFLVGYEQRQTFGSRLRRSVGTIWEAITPGGERIQARTSSPTANRVLEAGANHPFVTAGIATAGITAVRYAPAVAGSLRGATATRAAANTGGTVARSGALRAGLIGAGIGAGAVLLSGIGSGAKTGPQETRQTQAPSQNVQPRQDATQYTYNTDNSLRQQDTYNTIRDSPGATLYGQPTQNTSQGATQAPLQYVPSQQTAEQSAQQEATASSSGNSGLLWLALGAAALYMLQGDS